MAETRKILGQAVLTTAAAVYTVPATTQAVVSTIVVASTSSSIADDFSIWVVKSGDSAPANKQLIYYSIDIPANETFCSTVGITLNTGDSIWASGSGNASINIFGVEIT